LESTPKYMEVLERINSPVVQARAKEVELTRQKEQSAREISRRKHEGVGLAREATDILQEHLEQGGFVEFFEQAKRKFGPLVYGRNTDPFNKRLNHQVGASLSQISQSVYCWSDNLDETEQTAWVAYAVKGITLDYFKRNATLRGVGYQLSRYALLLIEADDVEEGETLIWHGELPSIELGPSLAHSSKFNKVLTKKLKGQNDELSGRSAYMWYKEKGGKGVVPFPPITELALVFEPESSRDYLSEIDQGLTEFVERHFVPVEEQPIRRRRILLPSIVSKEKV